jgi:DNA-binding XRE family transcriptional regulator
LQPSEQPVHKIFFSGRGPVTRRRDHLIDKKIGSTIRMQRVKLGMNQSELGNGLGVTFQQIQKYENGTNAVASTRIPALCRLLKSRPMTCSA